MIFVTGGTGFLGSYILQELVLQGRSVRALRRNMNVPFYLHPGLLGKISWVQGDILDVTGLIENMSGCEKIIHAAGMVSFNPSDKKKLFQLNIEGTANVVNAAIETGITDLVHVSSVSALGRQSDAKQLTKKINGSATMASPTMVSVNIIVKWKSGGAWVKVFHHLL